MTGSVRDQAVQGSVIEAAAKAVYEAERDPSYDGEEWDWPNIDRSYDKPDESITDPEWCRDEFRDIARATLAAAVPLLLADLTTRIEAHQDEHFREYGNEENGPRNYDWALPRALSVVAQVRDEWETK